MKIWARWSPTRRVERVDNNMTEGTCRFAAERTTSPLLFPAHFPLLLFLVGSIFQQIFCP